MQWVASILLLAAWFSTDGRSHDSLQEVRGSHAGDIGRLLRDMPEVPVSVGQTGEGNLDESLPDLPRVAAGVGDGQVLGLSGMEGEVNYSITVFGLAADGNPEPPSPAPGAPEPTVVITPVGTPVSACEWECILRTVGWDEWDIPEAGRKIQCESGFNPYAYNPSGASGWFQVMMPLHAYRLRPGEDIFDVYVNSRVALEIFRERGWEAWVC